MQGLVSVWFALLVTAGYGLAQTVHTVYVGVNGSYFSPPTLQAAVNDVVSFVFGADVHAVTESSMDKPCTPLDGGFSSGLAGLKGGSTAHETRPIPSWNLIATNASALFYVCDSIDPVYHCTSGMVGIINPSSDQQFTQFQYAAKESNYTPSAAPSVVRLNGLNAHATNSPSATSTTSLLLDTTATSEAPSPSSSTTSSSSHHSKTGAIVGGVVGGLVAFIVAVILIVHLMRRSRPPYGQFAFATKPAPGNGGLPCYSQDNKQIPSSADQDPEKIPDTPSARFMRKISQSEGRHSVSSTLNSPITINTMDLDTLALPQLWMNLNAETHTSLSSPQSRRNSGRHASVVAESVIDPGIPVPPVPALVLPLPPNRTPISSPNGRPAPPPAQSQVPGPRRPLPVVTPQMRGGGGRDRECPWERQSVPPPPITPSPGYSFDDPLPQQMQISKLAKEVAHVLMRNQQSERADSYSPEPVRRQSIRRQLRHQQTPEQMMMMKEGAYAPVGSRRQDKDADAPPLYSAASEETHSAGRLH